MPPTARSPPAVRTPTRPQTALRRRGVPQTIQPHGLITGGVLAMESLLPGFHQAACAAGAVPLLFPDSCWTFFQGGEVTVKSTPLNLKV